jgi:hypothetical protein
MKTRLQRTAAVCSCLLLVIAPARLLGQEEEPSAVRIENSAFSMLRDTVIITFRLVAPEDESYNIGVRLRKGDDTAFAIVPRSLVGAVGEVRGGGDRVILWDYRRDVPETFSYSDDYWFEITAVPIERRFSPEWWHYVAAGAGVAAAVAIIAGNGGDGPGNAASGLPDPPTIRPDQ